MTGPRQDPAALVSSDDVTAMARWLWREWTPRDEALVQPLAVWADGGGLRVLRIGQHAPKSSIDAFALGFTRARADAIVTSGATVRAEPDERYDLRALGPGGEALRRWRREVARRPSPPLVVVLTSGRGLDLERPLFRDARKEGRRVAIYTTVETANRLRPAAEHRGVALIPAPETSLPDVVRRLREVEGCRIVSVEAGPSASAPLHPWGAHPGPGVDELVLSVFEGTVPSGAMGPAFGPRAAVEGRYRDVGRPRPVEEPSGPWRFAVRRPAG